ncbi:hypothetical protein ACFQVD_23200 [Streptosporangium amethystogenes subsp. fukuiense]|uniref:Secreted protein n=1 Tax=Streptosporangium amethystogenes subsp. fukuiense TaxID=698418 RepID=A0ABW2T5C2_9ACTN
MNNVLSRVGTLAAGLALAAALVSPAQAAEPPALGVDTAAAGPLLKIVFGSLQAFDLEESGEDEIRVRIIGQNGAEYLGWPTNGDEADTKAGTCWVWEYSMCTPGSTERAAGSYKSQTTVAGGSFTIEVWEDDIVGDDLLLRIPVTATGGYQDIEASSPTGKGFSYRFVGNLEPA